jgi:hypothetical protein
LRDRRVGWDEGIPQVLRAMADLLDKNIENADSPWVPLPEMGDIMKAVKGHANPVILERLLDALSAV